MCLLVLENQSYRLQQPVSWRTGAGNGDAGYLFLSFRAVVDRHLEGAGLIAGNTGSGQSQGRSQDYFNGYFNL